MAEKQKMEIMKKSYVSAPQDEWVNGNMKTILDWSKKYNTAQYYNIKNAFNNYRKASGLNSKVKAFQELQNSLVNKDGVPLTDVMNGWYDEYEPKIREVANQYTNGDMDLVPLKPETKQMKEIWDAIRPSLSSIPKNEENDADLDVGDIYKENYNPNQMAKLAAQYGYDYSDKDDRNEFFKLANDYIQSKDLEKIWNEPSLGNAVTKIAYPVSTEYAKRNYNDIPTDNFWNFATGGENGKGMAKPMMVDALDQVAMAYGGNLEKLGKNVVTKTLGNLGGNLVLAPTLTEVGQVALNDKPVDDAVQDALVGMGTNYAGPGAVFGTLNKVTNKAKYLNLEKPQMVLQDQIDQAVNKASQTWKELRNGKQIKMNDGTFKKFNENGEMVATKYDPNKTFVTEDELNQAYGVAAIGRGDVAHPNWRTGTIGKNKQRNEILSNKNQKTWSDKIEEKVNENLMNRQPLSEENLSYMAFNPNYRESVPNAIGRWYNETVEAPKNLFTNLASSNRALDRLSRNFENLNGIYEYGQEKKKADDLTMDDINNDAEMGLYAKAYKNYIELKKQNFQINEPKKPKDLSEDKAKKIRASIKSVYGL